AGHHRAVSRRSVRRHVIVVGLSPRRAITYQSPETVWTKQIPKPLEIVVTKLVHHDQQDQFRTLLDCGLSPSLRKSDGHKETNDEENDRETPVQEPNVNTDNTDFMLLVA